MTEPTFTVGQKMSLDLLSGEDRIYLTLLGWEEKAFIIAKTPLVKRMPLTSYDNCVVRFLQEGVAFAFYSRMIYMQSSPIPLMFLRYPQIIKSAPFRKSARVKTRIHAKCMDVGNSLAAHDITILDISENGCLIEAEDRTGGQSAFEPANNSFYLTFMLLDRALELDCIAKNIRNKEGKYLIGTEFVNPGREVRELLKNFLYMFTEEKDHVAV